MFKHGIFIMNLTCSNCNKTYKKSACFDKHVRTCDISDYHSQNKNILQRERERERERDRDRERERERDLIQRLEQNNVLLQNKINDLEEIVETNSNNKIHCYNDWLSSINLEYNSTIDYLKNNSIENILLFIIKNNTQKVIPFYHLDNTIIVWDNSRFHNFKNENIIKLVSIIHQKITHIVCTWNEKNMNNIKKYSHVQDEYFNILDKVTESFQKSRKRIYSSVKQLINHIV